MHLSLYFMCIYHFDIQVTLSSLGLYAFYCQGTEEVLGLTLNMSKYHKVSFSAEAFKNMRSLRLLQLNYAQLSDCYKYYPMHKLRWLCWHGFPLDCIPKEFMQPNLVAVDLQFSKLTQAWKDCEV